MKEMRLMGNMAQKLAKEKSLNNSELSDSIGCTPEQFQSFLNGRLFLSFEQLEKLANLLSTTVAELMEGDNEHYEKTIVHCMGEFEDSENREKILNIIDDFISLKTAIEKEKMEA